MLASLLPFVLVHWPDLVLSIGSVLLDIFIISSITHHERKPPILMNLAFTLIVFSQAIVYGHYHDWFAFSTTAIGACEWGILLVQTLLMRHRASATPAQTLIPTG